MKENILKLENLLKIKFSNKALLIKAMTHKSFDAKFNNERLEERKKLTDHYMLHRSI